MSAPAPKADSQTAKVRRMMIVADGNDAITDRSYMNLLLGMIRSVPLDPENNSTPVLFELAFIRADNDQLRGQYFYTKAQFETLVHHRQKNHELFINFHIRLQSKENQTNEELETERKSAVQSEIMIKGEIDPEFVTKICQLNPFTTLFVHTKNEDVMHEVARSYRLQAMAMNLSEMDGGLTETPMTRIPEYDENSLEAQVVARICDFSKNPDFQELWANQVQNNEEGLESEQEEEDQKVAARNLPRTASSITVTNTGRRISIVTTITNTTSDNDIRSFVSNVLSQPSLAVLSRSLQSLLSPAENSQLSPMSPRSAGLSQTASEATSPEAASPLPASPNITPNAPSNTPDDGSPQVSQSNLLVPPPGSVAPPNSPATSPSPPPAVSPNNNPVFNLQPLQPPQDPNAQRQ